MSTWPIQYYFEHACTPGFVQLTPDPGYLECMRPSHAVVSVTLSACLKLLTPKGPLRMYTAVSVVASCGGTIIIVPLPAHHMALQYRYRLVWTTWPPSVCTTMFVGGAVLSYVVIVIHNLLLQSFTLYDRIPHRLVWNSWPPKDPVVCAPHTASLIFHFIVPLCRHMHMYTTWLFCTAIS